MKNILVSDQDRDILSSHKWLCIKTQPSSNTNYVKTKIKLKTTYLHRLIMERVIGRCLESDERVDHIDQNGLNNTRENLRIVTAHQNAFNQPKRKKSSSKYKGVTFFERDKSWHARICFNGKTIHLGYYHDESSAAQKYNEAASKYFGSYAFLNKV